MKIRDKEEKTTLFLDNCVAERKEDKISGKIIWNIMSSCYIFDKNKWIHIYDISSPRHREILEECKYENEYQNFIMVCVRTVFN